MHIRIGHGKVSEKKGPYNSRGSYELKSIQRIRDNLVLHLKGERLDEKSDRGIPTEAVIEVKISEISELFRQVIDELGKTPTT